jgi:hypothetical protein
VVAVMTQPRRRSTEGGWVLVAVGLLLLLNQWFPQHNALLLGLIALGFMAAAIYTHRSGLLVLGGIFTGLALGFYLIEPNSSNESTEGGLFLMAFAAGWALITLFSPLVGQWMWWPLIPASLLGFIGWTVRENRLELLEGLNWVWPVGLMLLGIWMLLRPPRQGKPS